MRKLLTPAGKIVRYPRLEIFMDLNGKLYGGSVSFSFFFRSFFSYFSWPHFVHLSHGLSVVELQNTNEIGRLLARFYSREGA